MTAAKNVRSPYAPGVMAIAALARAARARGIPDRLEDLCTGYRGYRAVWRNPAARRAYGIPPERPPEDTPANFVARLEELAQIRYGEPLNDNAVYVVNALLRLITSRHRHVVPYAKETVPDAPWQTTRPRCGVNHQSPQSWADCLKQAHLYEDRAVVIRTREWCPLTGRVSSRTRNLPRRAAPGYTRLLFLTQSTMLRDCALDVSQVLAWLEVDRWLATPALADCFRRWLGRPAAVVGDGNSAAVQTVTPATVIQALHRLSRPDAEIGPPSRAAADRRAAAVDYLNGCPAAGFKAVPACPDCRRRRHRCRHRHDTPERALPCWRAAARPQRDPDCCQPRIGFWSPMLSPGRETEGEPPDPVTVVYDRAGRAAIAAPAAKRPAT